MACLDHVCFNDAANKHACEAMLPLHAQVPVTRGNPPKDKLKLPLARLAGWWNGGPP